MELKFLYSACVDYVILTRPLHLGIHSNDKNHCSSFFNLEFIGRYLLYKFVVKELQFRVKSSQP
jgi:hypothetical protein